MGLKLLYAGFHTPKAVTYHEPTVMWLFMIGHSLGRMETCFAPCTFRACAQNTSQMKIFGAILKKGGYVTMRDLRTLVHPCPVWARTAHAVRRGIALKDSACAIFARPRDLAVGAPVVDVVLERAVVARRAQQVGLRCSEHQRVLACVTPAHTRAQRVAEHIVRMSTRTAGRRHVHASYAFVCAAVQARLGRADFCPAGVHCGVQHVHTKDSNPSDLRKALAGEGGGGGAGSRGHLRAPWGVEFL